MLKKLVAVAFAAALVGSGAACSSDDDGGGGDAQAQLADLLKEDAASEGTEVSDEEADCMAGAMVDLIGEDQVQEALDSGSEPDLDSIMGDDPEAALDFLDAMMECAPELMGDAMTEGMEDGSDGGSSDEG